MIDVALAARAHEEAAAYAALDPGPPAPLELVDRPAWAAANLRALTSSLDPLLERVGEGAGPLAGPLRLAARGVVTAEAAGVVALLATRVLGQYAFGPLDPAAPARLLVVEPNLDAAARATGADAAALAALVVVHESVHAVQFGGARWLRPHLAGLARELLGARDPGVPTPARLATAIRRGELVRLLTSPEQRTVIRRLQALMTVVEGHAEHVTGVVGERLHAGVGELGRALDRRRTTRSPLGALLGRLLGLDLKARQYREGAAFCDAVVREGGTETLARLWTGPETLPDAAELRDPQRWLARV